MDATSIQGCSVTLAEIEAYNRDGVVCLRGVFSEFWRELARRGLERNLREQGPRAKLYAGGEGKPRFFQDSCSWWRIPEYLAYCLNSPAAAIAGTLMGARRVNLFFDNIMLKDPGADAPTPWHHDVPYWPVVGDQVCSVWMPLDPITPENRLIFVRGSHSWGKSFTPMDFYRPGKAQAVTRADFEAIPDFDARRDEFEFVSFDMEPGDCVVFHGSTVHGAPGNMTSHPRRAMISRWTGDDVRYAGDKHDKLAPPFPRCGLKPGDPMTCETFPVVWEAPAPG
jgi:ectoine hydroxylase-related dioxygenase (phytanoyl-CoA dioxygenase family)